MASQRKPQSIDAWLDPAYPTRSAEAFIDQSYRSARTLTLRHTGGSFYGYDEQSGYQVLEDATIRSLAYSFLDKSLSTPRGEPFRASASKVNDVVDAVKAFSHLEASHTPPCWLDSVGPSRDPFDFLQCRNGLLYLPTRIIEPSTPRFFALGGVDFRYESNLPRPVLWLGFLEQLFPEDQQSQETLQEWIGYLLTSRTHFQKIMLLIGPKRSGKGTIGRVIRELLGNTRVAGPTLANLGEQFGLAVLLHKSAAIISDARISGRSDMAVLAERLLSISGEDTLSIPRKFLGDWTGKLPTRFMIMTNELPRIEDVSGALASRFLVLMLRESFYNREDYALFEKIRPELPSILNWALDGLDRLRARGKFVQPAAAAALIQQFEDLGSPISAFIRERCVVKPGLQISVHALFAEWLSWSKENGRESTAGNVQTFGKNLSAAVPWVTQSRPRVDGERTRMWEGIHLVSETPDAASF